MDDKHVSRQFIIKRLEKYNAQMPKSLNGKSRTRRFWVLLPKSVTSGVKFIKNHRFEIRHFL
jgi:hypothetical protein